MPDSPELLCRSADPACATAFADVILPRRLHRPFTYLIPDNLRGKVDIGQSVIVPFGTREIQGLVTALYGHLPSGVPVESLKAVRALASDVSEATLSAQQLNLSRWLAQRYAAPWGQCIKLVAPPMVPTTKGRVRYQPTDEGLRCVSHGNGLAAAEWQLLKRLCRRDGLEATTLERGKDSSITKALQGLIGKGCVFRRAVDGALPASRPRNEASTQVGQAGLINSAMGPVSVAREAVESWPAAVGEALSHAAGMPILLQSTQESRRWCLVQAAQETIRRGRRVLVVTGDVEHAKYLVDALASAGVPALLMHRTTSAKAQAAVWREVQAPSTNVVIGTRSAVFAPLERLGLIWVEGEDEEALKEEQVPRYHAREVAQHRALNEGALLVLSSSHPSLESWSMARRGVMTACLYRDDAVLPRVEVVDIHVLLKDRSQGLLSALVCEGLEAALLRNGLAVLYMNRRGFASVLHCRDCGAMPQCETCSIALTFSKNSQQMRCHYCGRARSVPDHCLQCQSLKLEPVGAGTERIEEDVRRLFPQVRVGRADGDTIRRPPEALAFRRALAAREFDVVIGTQMLFGLDLQGRAAFVAIPDADAGLHVSDFRAAERTYRGLVDAINLAEPLDAGGRVVVQTRFPDHHVMAALASGDESRFLEQELGFREMLEYPPFTQLVRLNISGTLEWAVIRAAERWAGLLRAEVIQSAPRPVGADLQASVDDVTVLGPSPAPHVRTRGRYCWQILVKSRQAGAGTEKILRTLERLERESRRGGLRFGIDVDPVTMV